MEKQLAARWSLLPAAARYCLTAAACFVLLLAGRVFLTASRPLTDEKNTGPVNHTNRSVYQDHQV
jgi:hypothetical protein